MNKLWILAQADGEGGGDGGGQPIGIETRDEGSEITGTKEDGGNGDATKEPLDRKPTNPWQSLIWFLPVIILFYFMMFRGPKKRQQQQQKMVSSLKANDRVRTIGGILGTIVKVEDERILLKIDESSNTKMWVVPGAISKLSSDDN